MRAVCNDRVVGRDRRRNGSRSGSARRLERRRNGWSAESASMADVGPGVRLAGLDESLMALDRLDPGLEWKAVAGMVVPLFQRVRPYPAGFPDAVRHVLPSGISVTFGIDTGPSFIHVTAQMIAGWKLGVGDVVDRAMRNL